MRFMKVILVLGMVALTFNLNAIESEQSVRATLSELCGEKSCKTIFKKLRKYARNGSPHAQSVLAMMYLGGIGVDQDLEAGYKYMRKSAKNGLAFAQYHLAIMYRDGVVTDKDEEESLKWLTKSASSGYRQAKALLNGEGKSTVNPEDFEGEHLVVTAESPTLTDFMEYLRALGYGKDGQTGSRIKGQGCANSAFSCLTWDVNTGGGRKNFDNMLSRLHSYNTALEMKRLGNTK